MKKLTGYFIINVTYLTIKTLPIFIIFLSLGLQVHNKALKIHHQNALYNGRKKIFVSLFIWRHNLSKRYRRNPAGNSTFYNYPHKFQISRWIKKKIRATRSLNKLSKKSRTTLKWQEGDYKMS